MPDSSYGAPQGGDGGGGFSRKVGPFPMWVWVAGVGAAVLFIYFRHRNAGGGGGILGASSGSSTGSAAGGGGLSGPTSVDGSGQVSFDPGTGLPIDPSTGLPYLNGVSAGGTQSTISGWVTSAEQAGKTLGLSPSAVNQALYDYTNGNSLSNGESGIIDTLLGKVGYPPDLLPFNGQPPKPPEATPPIVKPPPPPSKGPLSGKPLSTMQQFVDAVYAYIHRGANYKGPIFTAAQVKLAEADVKGGKAWLPAGFTAPAGYTLDPVTRYLKPNPAPVTRTTTLPTKP